MTWKNIRLDAVIVLTVNLLHYYENSFTFFSLSGEKPITSAALIKARLLTIASARLAASESFNDRSFAESLRRETLCSVALEYGRVRLVGENPLEKMEIL